MRTTIVALAFVAFVTTAVAQQGTLTIDPSNLYLQGSTSFPDETWSKDPLYCEICGMRLYHWQKRNIGFVGDDMGMSSFMNRNDRQPVPDSLNPRWATWNFSFPVCRHCDSSYSEGLRAIVSEAYEKQLVILKRLNERRRERNKEHEADQDKEDLRAQIRQLRERLEKQEGKR